MPPAMKRLVLAFVLLLTSTGCPKAVDKITLNRVIDRGRTVGDLGQACALGSSFRHALAAAGTKKHPPYAALIVAESTSGLCAQMEAWDAELAEARVRQAPATDPVAKANQIRDRRIALERANTLAAARFYQAWLQMEPAFGEIGGDKCPKIKQREEIAYVLGMVSGLLAMLHDGAGGGQVGVPLDTLAIVSRGATCLQDQEWWYTPRALQLSAWATVPNSGPEGVDPWAELELGAAAGEQSGVRVARAIQVLVAANSGRTDIVMSGVESHGLSLDTTPRDNEWALLDEYARRVTGHQSDLIWTEDRGYRTPTFGEIPKEPEVPEEPNGPDPFGDDDPFGG